MHDIHHDDEIAPVNYEEAFEKTGHGWFNILVLISCCFIFLYCSVEMAGMSYVITPIDCDINLTLSEKSLINAGIYFGIVGLSIFWGVVVDQYGRRKIMLPTLIGTIITSILSSVCTLFWPMFILRVIVGCLVSASAGTVLVYLGELHSKKHRDIAILVAVASDQINFIIFPGIAWIIIGGTWSFYLGPLLVRPWRVFMWFWGLSGLLGTAILFYLPESPRFVLAQRGPAAAMPILAKIYAINKKQKAEDYPVTVMTMPSFMRRPSDVLTGWRKILVDMTQVLRPPMLRCYLITHYCMFITYLLSNGFYMWMPSFINEVIRNPKCPCSMCDIINKKFMKTSVGFLDPHADEDCDGANNSLMYPISMAMELVYLIPFIVIYFIITRVAMTKIYIVIMGVCIIGMMGCFLIKQVIVAVVFLTIGLCSGGCVSVITALAVEAFPTKLRALTMCTLYMMGQLGALVGTTAINLMEGFWCNIIFVLFILAMLASGLMLLRCWPPLERVRAEMELRNFTY